MLSALKTTLRARFPWLADSWSAARDALERRRLARLTTAQVFQQVYQQNGWGSGESVSGFGSTLAYTEGLRASLPDLLRRCNVRSLLDIPCGDFNWLRHVDLELDSYVGADIVPELVERLQREFGRQMHEQGQGRRFLVLDLLRDPLPAADAILCRDCLVHLSNRDAAQALANLRGSPANWLIATTFPEVTENRDIATGQFRPVNLCLPPWGLPPPLEALRDTIDGYPERHLGVWRVTDLPSSGQRDHE